MKRKVRKFMLEIFGAVFAVVIMVGFFCKLWKIMFEEYLVWKEGD